jgi:hypothetical protein
MDAGKCKSASATTSTLPAATKPAIPVKSTSRAAGNNIKPTVVVSGGESQDEGGVASVPESVGGTGTAAGSSQKPASSTQGQKTSGVGKLVGFVGTIALALV